MLARVAKQLSQKKACEGKRKGGCLPQLLVAVGVPLRLAAGRPGDRNAPLTCPTSALSFCLCFDPAESDGGQRRQSQHSPPAQGRVAPEFAFGIRQHHGPRGQSDRGGRQGRRKRSNRPRTLFSNSWPSPPELTLSPSCTASVALPHWTSPLVSLSSQLWKVLPATLPLPLRQSRGSRSRPRRPWLPLHHPNPVAPNNLLLLDDDLPTRQTTLRARPQAHPSHRRRRIRGVTPRRQAHVLRTRCRELPHLLPRSSGFAYSEKGGRAETDAPLAASRRLY